MHNTLSAAVLTCLLAASSAAIAQTSPAPSAATPDKQDMNCNSASTAPGTAQTTGTSMAVEKSAILPSADGHSNSAAPTVQSDGKAMQARPDCPPETKPK